MSQKRMGPAPFASFEDLSDEVRHGVESPTTAAAPRLADIRECREAQPVASSRTVTVAASTASPGCLQTPNTPRIDISRASSSSHHEEDSRDSTPERELFEPQCARLGLAFREDGAMDLRSSTEELDFQEAGAQDLPPAETRSSSCRAPESHARKDSQGSELGFLSVSGRTSRLSSIGSQGSRASNQSHLSTATSRSPSPHKMLLETSFCGTKASEAGVAQPPGGAALEPQLEHALLSRRHDPTQAVLAEGISIELRKKMHHHQAAGPASPKRRPPCAASIPPIVVESDTSTTMVAEAPPPAHPMSPGKTIVADSGIEYTFIPLRGPLPPSLTNRPGAATKNKTPPVPPPARRPPPGKTAGGDSPEYIRIKLKPDHMYNAGTNATTQAHTSPERHKPVTLNLNNGRAAPHALGAPGGSPKLPRLRDAVHSRTPSPSVSRKSSFTSLFRSKEAIISSPESPGDHRARSKSKERDHKTSSVFGIFKPKKSCIKKQSSPEQGGGGTAPVTSPLPTLEFTFGARPSPREPPPERLKYYETPLEGDSIRIPLHSPGTEPEPLSTQSPSPPRQPPPPVAPRTSPSPQQPVPPPVNPRHSSTSSETIIFTTNLGSNNEIFTTKLPKEKAPRITENHCEKPVERSAVVPAETETDRSPLATSEPMTRSESSESEREIPEAATERARSRGTDGEDEHELKTLVFEHEQDSLEEDELPYVPTTLPLERSVAVPIVPVKQRGEIKMCGIERPRSTTPINPNCLDDYCEDGVPNAEPKLRISLPRDEPGLAKGKSPRKWADFAEMDMGGSSSPPPPPLPPRGAPKDWINFEEVPERRKPPKRIQIIPGRTAAALAEENVIYSYVNPEDCKCECHELAPRAVQPDHDKPLQPTPDAFPNHPKLSS